jgi:DNA-binding beta-propeller fold protein YncE
LFACINDCKLKGNVSTFAGRRAIGYLDGPANAALFSGPRGIAVDSNGFLYVADSGNNRIRKISPDGTLKRKRINKEDGRGIVVDSNGFCRFGK